jgi:hypothetical protein
MSSLAPAPLPDAPPPAPKGQPKGQPRITVAPYVESWGTLDLASFPTKAVTLAFLLSTDKKGGLGWDGSMAMGSAADPWVARAKKSGKRIVLSFGGQSGTELARALTDPRQIADAYVQAAKTYNAVRLDFDIEGGSIQERDTVSRRNTALKAVQQRLPGVPLQYTLPVMPSGLDPWAVALLKDAKDQGVALDCVNVMAMDYGDSFAGDMGTYAVQAATATRKQLDDLGLKTVGVGITPMTLKNDVEVEVFSLKNAKKLVSFARKTPWVRFIGYWSADRDKDRSFAKAFAQLESA